MRARRTWVFGTVLTALLSWSTPSASQEAAAVVDEPPAALDWRWRRAGVLDYASTGMMLITAWVAESARVGATPHWVGGVLFDDEGRDAFALSSFDDRAVAARTSDITVGVLASHVVLVDGLLLGALGETSSDTAWQGFVVSLETFSISLASTGVTKRITERERPSTTACRTDPSYDRRCEAQGKNGSFFSGHTSMAFTFAGLTCVNHAFIEQYGQPGDAIACGAAMAAATSVGVERIVADRHYISDVMTGAVVGATIGVLVPWGLYYARPDPGEVGVAVRPVPWATPDGAGLQMAGQW